jgi:hypothetical protein
MSDLNPVADVPGDCFTCVFPNEVPSAVHHQRWGDVAENPLSSGSNLPSTGSASPHGSDDIWETPQASKFDILLSVA